MGTLLHVVKAGDSPQALEKLYRVPWRAIADDPANAFLKTRKGYPIHPGDRLAIPPAHLAVTTVHAPQTVSPLFLEFLRIVEWNAKMLTMLTAQHPSKEVSVHVSAPPKKAPAVMPAKAGEVKGYKKSLPKMWSTVVLTSSIESAFTVLADKLPAGTVMTSGYRSDADQARVINEIYASNKGDATVTDVEARRQWLLSLKNPDGTPMYKIARVGSSPHRTGLAFDLSGAKLTTIKSAVELCAQQCPDTFPLHSTILEAGKQNCLHVNLKY